jgi:hypothetical protein
MIERKFNKAAIILSALAFIAGWSGVLFSIPAFVFGITAIVLSIKKRETHLVKLPVFLSVVAIITGIFFLLMFYTNLFLPM